MTNENRKTIFKEELRQLKEHDYIKQADYETVARAYDQYFEVLIEEERERENDVRKLQRARQEEAKRKEEERKEQIRLKKELKKLTPEQLRERNISLSLIAGVVLLLLGGLVLATSSWEKMNHMLKVFSIGGVSLLFFGISYISSRYLRIEKTAFAFLTLASLLIPVTFVGIGFFQLFGEWLSLFGEGKYVLGMIATVLCWPLYTLIALQRKNRLFVWLSLFTLTAMTGFLLAATYIPIDLFYLGIIVYNGLLLFGYHSFKTKTNLRVMMNELPLFTQANLVISTLAMLIFFENHLLYSVNILLTATLYISFVFAYNKKEFHFVFTLLFVYGMYQLLEHSFLQPLNYLGFALIGIIYLLIEDRITDQVLKKIFTYTSGIVSGLAFLYISLEGLVVLADENSVVLLLAYVIIACNYIYLAFLTERKVFRFLAPLFLIATGYQSWKLLSSVILNDFFEVYMFAVASVLFLFLYVKNNSLYLLPIQRSSFVVSLATMFVSVFLSYIFGKYLEMSILLFFFGIVLMIINKIEEKKDYKTLTKWLLPISWLLSLRMIYEQFVFSGNFYINGVGEVGHLALSSLLLLVVSYRIKKYRTTLFLPMFSVAMIGYILSLLTIVPTNVLPLIKSSFFFIGIFLLIVLVYETKKQQFWTLVAIVSAAFLFSLFEPLNLDRNYSILVLSLFLVPVLLLLVYEFIGRKINELKRYFFWTAHSIFLFVILGAIILSAFSQFQPLSFFLPFVAFIYSVFRQEKEWAKKLFLYSGLAMIPIIVLLSADYYELNITFAHSLAVSMLIIGLLWGASPKEWKLRIDLFLIPFGIATLISFHFLEWLDVVIIVMIAAFTIFLLFKRKWDLFSFVPLVFWAFAYFDFTQGLEKTIELIALGSVFFFLLVMGKLCYRYLYFHEQGTGLRSNQID